MKKLIYLLLITGLIFNACLEDNKKVEPILKEKKVIPETMESKVEPKTPNLNQSKVVVKDNVVEIYQPFKKNQLIGDSVPVDLTGSTSAMLSAYSLDNSKYSILFREKKKQTWGDWKPFHLNHHVNNPNRKVFEATNVSNDVELLQFKSSSATNSDVVFRLYRFLKN